MAFFENLLGIILYFTLFLYHLMPGILVITLFLAVLFYLISRVNVKNSRFGFNLLVYAKEFIQSGNKKRRINSNVSRYTELSKRPRVLSVYLPILIVLIIGYLIYSQVFFFAIVTSGSMVPTFNKNDLVFMQSISTEPEVSDIIMFGTKEAMMPVTHRVVSIDSGRIKTKGDARQVVDDWVIGADQIHAKAILYRDKPIVVKDIGSYFLFDPNQASKYTSLGGDQFYEISQFLVAFKKFGLLIFILCILGYLILAARDISK